MKRKLLLLTVLLSVMTAWADVEINETNFPDENFRNYLLSQEYGADGILTDEEIAGVTELYLSSRNIQSLKGIEYFTALTMLYCLTNQLTSLDVSKNTALTSLDCGVNQLTSLDVSKNTALTSLNCGVNQLTSLDVSQNTALITLSCYGNLLTSLDVSKNTALISLSCFTNNLTELNLSKNTELQNLYCGENPLKKLDISDKAMLASLNCNICTQLTELNLYACFNLRELYLNKCPLTSLDLSNCSSLKTLYLSENQLTTLDLSRIQLESLTLNNNPELMASLDLSNQRQLRSLSCSNNQLTSLDVSKNTKLMGLVIYQNQIKGEGMDALIKSMPTLNNGMRGSMVVHYGEDEGNEMTPEQVAAAKAKGWDTYSFNGSNYQEYEGSDPEPVIIAEETTVNPSETAESGQATTTESGVTTSLGDEDVVDAAEGSVTIVSSMTNDAVKELIETTQPGSSYFNETFKGFYFLLAAGKGKVEFDIETSGGYSLGVMKGTELVGVYTQSTKGTVTIPYDLEEDTWFFAYPVVNTPAAANRAAVAEGALKVYGLRIIPETQPDGINNLTPAFAKGNGTVYNLQGQRINGLQKGLNIVDGKKVMVK